MFFPGPLLTLSWKLLLNLLWSRCSGKYRKPAWTDRVLWLESEERKNTVTLESYVSYQSYQTSDHRPVGASLALNLNVSGCIWMILERCVISKLIAGANQEKSIAIPMAYHCPSLNTPGLERWKTGWLRARLYLFASDWLRKKCDFLNQSQVAMNSNQCSPGLHLNLKWNYAIAVLFRLLSHRTRSLQWRILSRGSWISWVFPGMAMRLVFAKLIMPKPKNCER